MLLVGRLAALPPAIVQPSLPREKGDVDSELGTKRDGKDTA